MRWIDVNRKNSGNRKKMKFSLFYFNLICSVTLVSSTQPRSISGPFYSRGLDLKIHLKMNIQTLTSVTDAMAAFLSCEEIEQVLACLGKEAEHLTSQSEVIKSQLLNKIKTELILSAVQTWVDRKASRLHLDAYFQKMAEADFEWALEMQKKLKLIEVSSYMPRGKISMTIIEFEKKRVALNDKIESNLDQPELHKFLLTLRKKLDEKIFEWNSWMNLLYGSEFGNEINLVNRTRGRVFNIDQNENAIRRETLRQKIWKFFHY